MADEVVKVKDDKKTHFDTHENYGYEAHGRCAFGLRRFGVTFAYCLVFLFWYCIKKII